MLSLQNITISIDQKEIIHSISFDISSGDVHAIMGPNGSGKTSLAMGLMGHPSYKLKAQSASWRTNFKINNVDVINLPPEGRAKAGLFVSFQSPLEIQGVSFLAFVRTAAKSLRPDEKISLTDFKKTVVSALRSVGLNDSFMHRSLNEGFSGGERKRAEIAQMIILKPRFVILDEIDSGLDVDSLKIVANVISDEVKKNRMGVLLITHYQRLLHYIKPDKVHVLVDGFIKKSSDMSLVRLIEKGGYAGF